MPFVSAAQRRWGNSPAGVKALGGPAKVAEWNSATPKKLPARKSSGGILGALKKPKRGK